MVLRRGHQELRNSTKTRERLCKRHAGCRCELQRAASPQFSGHVREQPSDKARQRLGATFRLQQFPKVGVGLAIWTAQELVSPNGRIPGTAACPCVPAGSGGARARWRVLLVAFEISRCQACRMPPMHRDDALAGVADGHDRLRVFGQAYEGLLGGFVAARP